MPGNLSCTIGGAAFAWPVSLIWVLALSCAEKETASQPSRDTSAGEAASAEAEVTPAAALEEESPAPETEGVAAPAELEKPVPPVRQPADFLAGRAGGVQFVHAFVDSFDRLSQRRRLLAYHLAQALLAGRDIVYDQLHENGLELRTLFENLHEYSADSSFKANNDITAYLFGLWINWGPYDSLSRRKLVPSFDYQSLCVAAAAANALGAELTPAEAEESLEQKLARLKAIIFDPQYRPMLAVARPQLGEDPLAFSNLNIYAGCNLRQLAGYEEKHPLNSRLVSVEGRIIEDVYRAGDKLRKIPRGRYFSDLRRLILHLEDAQVDADRGLRQALSELIEHFRTGEAQDFQRACISLSSLEEEVLFSLGFSNLSLDPRRRKGILEGFVALRHPGWSARLGSLMNGREKILDSLNWPEEWKNRPAQPSPAAVAELLLGIGRQGPLSSEAATVCGEAFAGSLPPARVLFLNLVEARARVLWQRISEAWSTQVVAVDSTDFVELAFAREALRSVLAPGLGLRPSNFHSRLWPNDLLMLHLQNEALTFLLIDHPLLEELGWFPNPQQRQLLRRLMLLELLTEQALWSKQQLVAPQSLARRLLLRYFLEGARLLEVKFSGSEPQLLLAPEEKWSEVLSRLNKRIQRIIFTSDRLGAQRWVEKYAAPPAAAWVEAMGRAAQQAGLLPRPVLVMPQLEPLSAEGRVVDVAVRYSETFEQQMMRFRKP